MKFLVISFMVLGSCKPIARDQQTLANDSEKVEVKFLHTDSGAAKLMGCSLIDGLVKNNAIKGECHNLLKNKKGDTSYEFFRLDAVLTDIEKSKEKQTGLRKKVLVGAVTVGVGVALAFGIRAGALKKQIKYIDDLKGDMLRYSEAEIAGDISKQNEYAEKLSDTQGLLGDPNVFGDVAGSTRALKREWRKGFKEDKKYFDSGQGDWMKKKKGLTTEEAMDYYYDYSKTTRFLEDLPNFSKNDTYRLREALYQVNDEDNLRRGVSILEGLFLAKGKSVQFAHGVIVGSLAGVSGVSAHHFWREMSENKKLKAQSRNIVTLFRERTPITLSNDELKQLLKVLSKYLPAKIDKNGLKQLS